MLVEMIDAANALQRKLNPFTKVSVGQSHFEKGLKPKSC